MIDAAIGFGTAILEITTPYAGPIFILTILAAIFLNLYVADKINIAGVTLAVLLVGAGAIHFLYAIEGVTGILEPIARFTIAAIILGGAYKKFVLDS